MLCKPPIYDKLGAAQGPLPFCIYLSFFTACAPRSGIMYPGSWARLQRAISRFMGIHGLGCRYSTQNLRRWRHGGGWPAQEVPGRGSALAGRRRCWRLRLACHGGRPRSTRQMGVRLSLAAPRTGWVRRAEVLSGGECQISFKVTAQRFPQNGWVCGRPPSADAGGAANSSAGAETRGRRGRAVGGTWPPERGLVLSRTQGSRVRGVPAEE